MKAAASTFPLMSRDLLTGLANRRKFRKESMRIFRKLSESDRVCSLLLVSVNDFDQINRRYGHARSYRAVASIGRLLTSTLRPGDLIGRLGKATFCMCLPDEVQSDTSALGERLCRVIEENAQGLGIQLMCRYAVATVEPAKSSFDAVLKGLR
jgi:diguanylate cyclase (GGDEF)-like protein